MRTAIRIGEGCLVISELGRDHMLIEPKQVIVGVISDEGYDTLLSRNKRIRPLMVVLNSLREV
jgi:hypothetical protein